LLALWIRGLTVAEKKMRRVEVLKATQALPLSLKARWKTIAFEDLKKGYIFRLWEEDGSPDYLIDGKHDVCLALEDAYLAEDGTPTVNCVHVNGLVP
jgi:hypothetical protein